MQIDEDLEDKSSEEADLGLREQKRLETKLRIEVAATRLVEKSSLAEVTIEQICEIARISRRTFFNYFSSKEAAVLGTTSEPLSAEQRTEFLTDTRFNLLQLLVKNIEEHLSATHQNPELFDRRRRIYAQSDVAVRATAFRTQRTKELVELATQRLTEHPEERSSPELDPGTEAMLIIGFLREATWLTISRLDKDCELPISDRIYNSMKLMKDYTKGLEWSLPMPPQAAATNPVQPLRGTPQR